MAQKPNILFLQSDEHSPHAIGCEGNNIVQTPHLDRLAESGTYFDGAYCQFPLCTPSRMCMLTGKYAHQCSAWNNGSILYPEHVTMPGHFAEHGYTTALVGKMHFGGKEQFNGFQSRPYGDIRGRAGHQRDPLRGGSGNRTRTQDAGITEIPSSLLQERVVNEETIEYLRSQPADQPWFLLASYSRPHFPLTAPKRLFDKYYPDNVDMPNIPPGHLEQTHRYAKGLRKNFNTAAIPEEEARKSRAAYYACCEFLDECVGDLLTILERDGLLENTIIVYTTDHGEMAGEHGQWWKSSYYEAAARVPLIIHDRRSEDTFGRRVNSPVELNDLFPTLCARAGIPIPDGLDGSDLSNLMSGNTGGWRNTAISEYWANQTTGPMRMLRTPRYKYVAFPEDESILFDLENDPGEFENLAGKPEHSKLEASLHKQLMAGFSWESVENQKNADKERSKDWSAPWDSGTPNQYTLPDGRIVDAELCLYNPVVVEGTNGE